MKTYKELVLENESLNEGKDYDKFDTRLKDPDDKLIIELIGTELSVTITNKSKRREDYYIIQTDNKKISERLYKKFEHNFTKEHHRKMTVQEIVNFIRSSVKSEGVELIQESISGTEEIISE